MMAMACECFVMPATAPARRDDLVADAGYCSYPHAWLASRDGESRLAVRRSPSKRCATLDVSRRLRMDGKPLPIPPNDLYRLGTQSGRGGGAGAHARVFRIAPPVLAFKLRSRTPAA